MTSTATLVLFLPTASITVASPGPTVLLVLSDGSRHGLRGALPGIAGLGRLGVRAKGDLAH